MQTVFECIDIRARSAFLIVIFGGLEGAAFLTDAK